MDELYTVIISEQPEKGEKIPARGDDSGKKTIDLKKEPSPQKIKDPKNAESDWEAELAKRRGITAGKESIRLFNKNILDKKSFYEYAVEYAGKTHEKTEHIPFACYWPSYEYMSGPQLDWYFYFRDRIKNGEYLNSDLSYIFVYIYELINQIGVKSPEDGFYKMVSVWKNYRKIHEKLDRYLIDWTSDYIRFYKCEAKKAFEFLEKNELLFLMPADMQMEYYIKNNIFMPIELIARFSDYKFYESEFIKSEDGNLFTENLSGLFNELKKNMEKEKEGSFETRFAPLEIHKQNRMPFLRAPFNNENNVRLKSYYFYEQHKPLRNFFTAVVKEFENQLRILKKYKGRLRPESLSVDIINICKTYAKNAVEKIKTGQHVEITIDRDKLFGLIRDSDEVRKKLLEGNYEYGEKDISAPLEEAGAAKTFMQNSSNKILPGLSPLRQNIIDFLLEHGGSCGSNEFDGYFSGIFIGVEIDGINETALEKIGDLLIGFEDDRWYIIEDYIDDLK